MPRPGARDQSTSWASGRRRDTLRPASNANTRLTSVTALLGAPPADCRTDPRDDDREAEHRRAGGGKEETHPRQAQTPPRQTHDLVCRDCLADPEIQDEEEDGRHASGPEHEERQGRRDEPRERERAGRPRAQAR